jgi:HAD superfamily hydrolase (TIGR01484 family)
MTGAPLLLCTDLDRTLLPNGEAPESPGVRRLFSALVSHPEVLLVYVTGRDAGRVRDASAQWHIPVPDLVIADVGTSIYDLRSGGWARWGTWDAEIGEAWALGLREALADALAGVRELTAQEPDRQGPMKLSYFARPGRGREGCGGEVERRVLAAGPDARLIWSFDDVASVELLDVVPARASKRRAIDFVRDVLGVAIEDTVFAGDSGNDLDVLISGVPSVLVANASEEVRALAVRGAAEAGTEGALYLARGGFRGTNGNYASGILEGVARFHPQEVARWLPAGAGAPEAGLEVANSE